MRNVRGGKGRSRSEQEVSVVMTLSMEPLAMPLLWYEGMLRIRRFEEAVRELVNLGKTHGFVHLCIGEEAVHVGSLSTLTDDDWVLATHRSHGALLASGAEPGKLLAEILGREGGFSRGRGGEMHMAIPAKRVLATSGIVGGNFPLAVGAGLALKNEGRAGVVICIAGDGALAEGTFHESVNVATLWRLPIVFVISGNRFAELSPIAQELPRVDLPLRAKGYGCRGFAVDGNDVEAVHRAVASAKETALADQGPVIIEAQTFLLCGHYEGVPLGYRDHEADAQAWADEPIVRLGSKLEGTVGAAILRAIEEDVAVQVKQAVQAALCSPLPDPEELTRDVYS